MHSSHCDHGGAQTTIAATPQRASFFSSPRQQHESLTESTKNFINILGSKTFIAVLNILNLHITPSACCNWKYCFSFSHTPYVQEAWVSLTNKIIGQVGVTLCSGGLFLFIYILNLQCEIALPLLCCDIKSIFMMWLYVEQQLVYILLNMKRENLNIRNSKAKRNLT